MPESKTRWRATVAVTIGAKDKRYEAGDLLPPSFKPPKLWIDRGTVERVKGA